MKRQLKSVKFGGYSSFFSCLLYSTLTVVSLFESRSAQLEDENVKWSFFWSSAQGDRKGPALVHKRSRSVLFWMSSPSHCDCAVSTPRCHDNTLRLMRRSLVRHPVAPCQSRSFGVPYHDELVPSTVANQPKRCTLHPADPPSLPPPPPQSSASCHQVTLATVAAATTLIKVSWFGFRMLNRGEQTE